MDIAAFLSLHACEENLHCTLELYLNCKIFKPIQRCLMNSEDMGMPVGFAAELMQNRTQVEGGCVLRPAREQALL